MRRGPLHSAADCDLISRREFNCVDNCLEGIRDLEFILHLLILLKL